MQLWLVAAALLVATAIAVEAIRRPILWRMAARNAWRRPKQTTTVIAGLMIGTAIISASLVAGASATSAIRGAVLDALGETDETVRADTFAFYPESIGEAFLADPTVAGHFDASAPFVIWNGAATHPGGLFEPGVSLVGYDRVRDAGFGDFELAGGGRTDGTALPAGSAYATAELADALGLQVGDAIQVSLTPPVDPLLPDLDFATGTLTGAEPSLLPLPPTGGGAEHSFDVAPGARQLTYVLLCGDPSRDVGCPAGTTFRLEVEGPDGTTTSTQETFQPCTQCPARTLWLNLTAPVDGSIASGTWTARISGTGANAPYALVSAALRPVYDQDELQARAEALAESPLAERLDGDLFGTPTTHTVRIAGITDGGRGDFFDLGPALFMSMPDLQTWLDRPGQINFLKFSNPGDRVAGAAGTDEAVQILNATLDRLRAEHPDLLVLDHIEVNPAKQEFLELADQGGELLTSLLIFAGSLTVITGLLLIINIFTMLAEERRSELGMARAVGLSRRDLVRLFLFEGSLYAVIAAFLGALLGIALAFGLVALLNRILAGLEASFPPIPFYVPPSAIPVAFSVGLLLTFATIFFASRRQSRLNIVRAIRAIDEPENQGRRWAMSAGLPMIAVGLTGTVLGWIMLANENANGDTVFPSFSAIVFGPLLAAIGTAMVLRRRFRRARIDVSLAAVLFAYYVLSVFTVTEFPDLDEANIVGPTRGVLLTLAAVMMVSYWRTGPRLLGIAMARLRRLRAVAIPAVSYPQHKRFRTGMTLAMFSVVILSIGFFSIFGALFEVPAERQTGGFDVEATTSLRVDGLDGHGDGSVAGVRDMHRLLDHFSFDPDFISVNGQGTGQFGPPGHHVYGVDQAFIDDQAFRLLWTLDERPEQDTYQRLLDEPGTIIVSYPYSTDERNQDLANEVGDTLTLHIGRCGEPGREACPTYTIIGIQEQYHFVGVFLPQDEVMRLFPQADSLYLFHTEDGADPAAVADALERNYRDIGMDAEPSVELVEKEQEGFRQILAAMKLFLALGLIVGVLSLGIVTSRSVLERRQEIGMLRALGFTRRQVQRIFIIEVSLIIAMGFVIGFLCSVIVTYGLWFAVIRELQYPYTIPYLEIFWLFLASYIVAMLATLAPIVRVGRVAPAEALRYVE